MNSKSVFRIILSSLILIGCGDGDISQQAETESIDWPAYLGGAQTNQYSTARQINKVNVANLKVAWQYKCGDADPEDRTQIQCNPLIIDGVLYASSPSLKFFALEASNGKELWKFDPFAGSNHEQFGMGANRGVTYWTDGRSKRLFFTAGSDLFCVDAMTGMKINSFGENGQVDLHKGLGRDVDDLFINSRTPGIVYKDLLIQGGTVSESTGAAPGHIRAYNVHTGEIEWIFHTIPYPEEEGYETWPEDAWQRIGGANAWAGFSLDEDRGIVFIPTGSASFDFYGGDRSGENLYANCLIALDANNGKKKWHYQFVHHDIWDRDLPCPPNLVTLTIDGKRVDAVAQVTKSSHVFIFNRETGTPLFPIEEIPVEASPLEGEQAWPTQPLPTKPPQFSRSYVSSDDLTQRTPEANIYARSIYENVRNGKYFVPPSEQGSFIFPGLDGGGEWGGGAADPNTGILYINASEMAWVLQMLPYEKPDLTSSISVGKSIYSSNCQICHGADYKGMAKDIVPSLINLKDSLDQPQVIKTISEGKGAMPAFSHLKEEEIASVSAFLLGMEDQKLEATQEESSQSWPYPYYFNGYNRFNDPEGYPAICPPWGTLNAIDLNRGEILWKVPLGDFEEIDYPGHPVTGTEGYGGPIITASGILFIAATKDEKFRAFDTKDGSLLWEADLPASGFATPSTYVVDGKQFVVIACGGGKIGRPSGDQYVAFSL